MKEIIRIIIIIIATIIIIIVVKNVSKSPRLKHLASTGGTYLWAPVIIMNLLRERERKTQFSRTTDNSLLKKEKRWT